jgi:glycosyltransferase involved in cell wall biosynthesis
MTAGDSEKGDKVPRNTGNSNLSVLLPVYNEASTIGDVLSRIRNVAIPKQIVVVDDGSTDDTRNTLKSWKAKLDGEILFHPRNMGKGRAIRTAMEAATGEFSIIQDADLEYSPEDYPKLLEPLLARTADVVYGSRFLAKSLSRRRFNIFRAGVSLLNITVRLLYSVRLTDEATCYKVFPTAVLRAMDLKCERFEFCPEVTAKACRMGLRIVEVPVRYNARTKKEGKKIRWRDGLTAVWTLWKWRKWQPPEAARQIVREYKERQRVDRVSKLSGPHSARCDTIETGVKR